MATQLDSLLKFMATDLPGATEADKRWALNSAWVDFCRQSRAWREERDVEVEANARAVELGNWETGDGQAVELLRVVVDGCDVTARIGRTCALRRVTGGVQALVFVAAPVEDRSWTLTIEAVLVPDGAMAEGPDWLIDGYGEGIAQGAIAKLKRQFKKSYTDFAGVGPCEREFRRAVAFAAIAGAQQTWRAS